MGRVLALDVGEKRVGVALSDPSRTLARPLRTLSQHPRPDHFAALASLLREYSVDLIVVGLPLSLDGTHGPQARRVAGYTEALLDRVSVPVVTWDERYSTAVARELMRTALKPGKRRSRRRNAVSARHSLDAVAASVILRSYLDSQAGSDVDREGSRYLGSQGTDTSPPEIDLTTQSPSRETSEGAT